MSSNELHNFMKEINVNDYEEFSSSMCYLFNTAFKAEIQAEDMNDLEPPVKAEIALMFRAYDLMFPLLDELHVQKFGQHHKSYDAYMRHMADIR